MKAILLTLALSLSFATMAADENTFESQMLGFSLTKPESWNFVSANTYLQRTKEATLKKTFSSAEFANFSRTNAMYSWLMLPFNPKCSVSSLPLRLRVLSADAACSVKRA